MQENQLDYQCIRQEKNKVSQQRHRFGKPICSWCRPWVAQYSTEAHTLYEELRNRSRQTHEVF